MRVIPPKTLLDISRLCRGATSIRLRLEATRTAARLRAAHPWLVNFFHAWTASGRARRNLRKGGRRLRTAFSFW